MKNGTQNYNSKVLVEMWTDFIDWDKRRKGEDSFLLKQFKESKCKKIFDACLGDGVDSIYLLKNGFDVVSNDLDKLFIKKAKQNAKKYDVKLNVTQYDWRDLDKHFKAGSFDSVICMGNSLTYLFDEKDRYKTLKNFLNILEDDGVLIIDERNYQYLLDNKKDILDKSKFRYSNKYIYCGKNVCGKPIEISDNEVKMEYTDRRNNKKAHLVLYPFKHGELLNLLEKAGFKKIIRYSDYKKGDNPTADFYQYVCLK